MVTAIYGARSQQNCKCSDFQLVIYFYSPCGDGIGVMEQCRFCKRRSEVGGGATGPIDFVREFVHKHVDGFIDRGTHQNTQGKQHDKETNQ